MILIDKIIQSSIKHIWHKYIDLRMYIDHDYNNQLLIESYTIKHKCVFVTSKEFNSKTNE